MLGKVFENDLYSEHRILVSPKLNGRIVEMAPEGMYTMRDTVAVIETTSGK